MRYELISRWEASRRRVLASWLFIRRVWSAMSALNARRGRRSGSRIVRQGEGIRCLGDALRGVVDPELDGAARQLGLSLGSARGHEAGGLAAQFLVRAHQRAHHSLVGRERGAMVAGRSR